MNDIPLTVEQEAEAEALVARLKSAFEQEVWQLARRLASKADRQLLGGDGVRGAGAGAWARGAGGGERTAGAKKKATAGRVSGVRTARLRPGM